MTEITALGYLAFEVRDLGTWKRFATDVLGLCAAGPEEDGMLRLRMDDYEQRILLRAGPADDVAAVGWEVTDAASLDRLAARLRGAGVTVREGTAEERAGKRVERMLCFVDPAGMSLEAFCGPAIAVEPFRSPRLLSRFVTADQGLGHVVAASRCVAESLEFYVGSLGFAVSDRIRFGPLGSGFEATFLHVNPRHHSLAFAEGMPFDKRIHHFMIELASIDDVGRALDRCLDSDVPVTRGLGRHPNDKMLSFYARTPSGFEVEIGWEGRRLDEGVPSLRTYGAISEWGHRPVGG